MATVSRRSSGANSNASNGSGNMMTMTTPTKKPKRRNERNKLTFYEKIAVIRYYEDTNISRSSLAKIFHCCVTQIRGILERKHELMQQLATFSEADASIIMEEMTRKRRKFEMSAISFILHQWVERCRQLRLRKSITNETLKDTAIKMAAILNLPAFRPSYRWLNRFRDKYKYNDKDLGAGCGSDTVAGELAVEDIIIEYKDSLPSFMQKEIIAITSASGVDESLLNANVLRQRIDVAASNNLNGNSLNNSNNNNNANSHDDEDSRDFEISEDDEEEEANDGGAASAELQINETPLPEMPPNINLPLINGKKMDNNMQDCTMTAGSAALLHSIFPHLAVIHQFALLNMDVKALELISQLGVHMQTQAAEGAYKQLSLAAGTPTTAALDPADMEGNSENLYPDIDDIVLIE